MSIDAHTRSCVYVLSACCLAMKSGASSMIMALWSVSV